MAMALPPPSAIAPRGGSVARRPFSQSVHTPTALNAAATGAAAQYYVQCAATARKTHKATAAAAPWCRAAAACVRAPRAVAVSVCRVL